MTKRDTISATTDPKSRTTPPAGSARVRGRIAAAGLVIAVVAASLAMVMPLASHGTGFKCNGKKCSASSCQYEFEQSSASETCKDLKVTYDASNNTCSLRAHCRTDRYVYARHLTNLNNVKMGFVRYVYNCNSKLQVGRCNL